MMTKRRWQGVNVGGWLLMEGYLLGGRNLAQQLFCQQFQERQGKREWQEFLRLFQETFITKDDFARIAAMGANCVRVPFHYKLVEARSFAYSEAGLSLMERLLDWGYEYKLGVILDLHAAPGAQNADWHSDSTGKALLWEDKSYQVRTIALWEVIVNRFKEHPALIGYDVLNEPVVDTKKEAVVGRFYKDLIRHLQAIDQKHTLFLEGNLWSTRIDFLQELLGDNIAVSLHSYVPLSYTFNFTPGYTFPGKIEGVRWNTAKLFKHLEPYAQFSRKNKVDMFVGEFGINWRGGHWGELRWLQGMLDAFAQFGFDYTYWTYKAIAHNAFPDGLYQAIENGPYIKREGFATGWETYVPVWRKEKKNIVSFWQTKHFTPNLPIINTLKKAFRKK